MLSLGVVQNPIEIMLREHLESRDITDEYVLNAMRTVSRELFVAADLRQNAYDDRALPIGSGQTISQPYIVALMLQLAHITPDSTVLDIGTGCGYMAAVAAQIASHVYTIECVPELTEQSMERFETMGISNIDIHIGDGSLGWPGQEMFDAILISCATDEAPKKLISQLKPHGRMVLPIRQNLPHEILTTYHKSDSGDLEITEHLAVKFVPMV